MSDNTVPAWATALLDTMNAHFDQVDHRLERLELATDRMTTAVETRMGLRDGPQT